MIKAKVGDKVYVECFTSMGAGSNGEQTVTKITKKYDEDTGKPYRVIWCGTHGFDSRDGHAITVPLMFHIGED